MIIVIPGPSMLFAIGCSLSLDRRGGALSAVGNAGMVPQLLAVALGVGALLAAAPASLRLWKTVLPQFAEPAVGSLPLQLAVLGAVAIGLGASVAVTGSKSWPASSLR